MSKFNYIACDLGAESGRVILGALADGKLTLEEIHRFPTGASRIQGSMRWNVLRIFEELKAGLRKVAAKGTPAAGVSVDSWGVDYALFNARQPLLSLPYHYRDSRTERTYPRAMEKAGLIFSETGIQFMTINTLYHLIADVEENADVLGVADQFLNIADYLNYLFSGVARSEVSLASTTQMFSPVAGDWSNALIDAFSLPRKLFPQIVGSGTKLGPLLPELCSEMGLSGVEVVATCSHDTGAAVAAVPAKRGDDWAYLSSGTWSLIGVELPEPLINDAAREMNFTNEAGYGGTTRFHKNIVGLWLLQESRRAWAREGKAQEYAAIMQLAEKAEPFRSLIDPNDERFVRPDDMPKAIADFCHESGQPAPKTVGQFGRCILESLALLYRGTLADLEQLTGRSISRLHIVGGGSQSALLNQFAANATGRTVLAGPVEATATGNVLIQAIALGHLDSLEALREVVKNSFSIQQYQPQPGSGWQQAIERFDTLK